MLPSNHDKELIILRGYPGSGKSTWAKQWVQEAEEDGQNRARVNRDDIRKQLFGKQNSLTNWQEKAVTAVEDTTTTALLKQGYSVVIDATNLVNRYASRFLDIADANGAHVHEVKFDASPETCVLNLAKRAKEGGDYVPPNAVYKMAGRFPMATLPPIESPYPLPVPLTDEERSEQLPVAVIVDLDGTLAINDHGRPFYGPNAAEQIHKDSVNNPVACVLDALTEFDPSAKLLFVSGRSEDCREETEKWLEANHFSKPTLLMRAEGDTRPDAVVKLELFEEHIRGKYDVFLALDDRDICVRLWRRLGIPCFQVREWG